MIFKVPPQTRFCDLSDLLFIGLPDPADLPSALVQRAALPQVAKGFSSHWSQTVAAVETTPLLLKVPQWPCFPRGWQKVLVLLVNSSLGN